MSSKNYNYWLDIIELDFVVTSVLLKIELSNFERKTEFIIIYAANLTYN